MPKSKLSNNKIISIVFIVIGAGLTFWGFQKSGGLGSQLSSAFSGSPSDNVMILYIAGIASIAGGIYLYIKK